MGFEEATDEVFCEVQLEIRSSLIGQGDPEAKISAILQPKNFRPPSNNFEHICDISSISVTVEENL